MPARRHFFRSPSPIERRQAMITASIHTHLSFCTPRPGPHPIPIKERQQEPAGSWHMVSGVNEAVVLEMFQSYRRNFRLELNIIGDNNDEINRQCIYTREYKLAAIDYALNTWERLKDR